MIQWVPLGLSHIKNQFEDPDDEAADKVYNNGVAVPYTGTNESFFSESSSYYGTLYEQDDLTARLFTTMTL